MFAVHPSASFRNAGAVRAAAVLGLAVLAVATVPARAATVVTPVSGSLGKTFQTCLLGVTTSVGAGENCTYGGVSVSTTQPFGENVGPLSLGAYYSSTTKPQAFTDPDFVPANGDGKVAPAIDGTITIDDNGTPGNGADDLISFTLTLTDPLGGNLIRVTNNFAERYASLQQVLAPRAVSAAAPNGAGGFDYVIGATGFPALLTYNQAPCAGQAFGSMECSASFDGTVIDPLRWNGWPANAGLGSLEGNTGAKTTGTVTGLQCAGTAGAGANIGTICTTSQVAWAPVVIGPNNTGGGSSPTARGSAEDVGWDQLLLRVSTNAAGEVTTVAGYDVEDYRAFGPARCGDNEPTTGNYVAVCNSWHSSYFTLAGVAAVDAVDDGPFNVLAGVTATLDVLANDANLSDPVTVTIATPPAKGTAVVVGSPGDPAAIRIEYTADPDADGADSFTYTVSDGETADTATVTLNLASAIPIAADGSITLSTAGVDPVGVAGTFNAPGPGGSLGAPGAANPVAVTVQGARGTATVAPGGTLVTYTVTDPGFLFGSDSFTYEITDGDDATDTGVVTVTIPDVAPVLADSVLLASAGRESPATALALTPGNGAPAAHTLVITGQAANGTCALTAPDGTGQLRYTGNPGFTGSDSCQLSVTDADGDSDVATVAITVSPVGAVGGAGAGDGTVLAVLGLLALAVRRRRATAVAGSPAATALLAVLAGLAVATTPARAQDAPSGAAAGPAIAEIVVTTRKVAESLKDVPLSITAFDSATIQQAGIANLTDVAELTPGLSFFNAFGENLPVPVIRGVAPTDIFGQNNAAIFIDGVYISGREGLNFSQLDFERIEVVKGPQSAQYGRNAFSGAINYVTKDPGDEFEGRTVVEAGNDGKRRGLAMVSGPLLGETLTGRLSYQYDEWDGSYDDPLSGLDVGGYRYRSWQGKLLWRPTDSLRVNLGYYKSNDRVDDPAAVSLQANCEDRPSDAAIDPPDTPSETRLQNFCGEIPDLKDVPGQNGGKGIAKTAGATGEERELDRVILRADWDAGFGTFTSLTGYSSTEQKSASDFSRNLGDSLPFLYCQALPGSEFGPAPNSCGTNPANLTFFTGILNPEGGDETEEWSQEIRFATPRDRRWRAVLGAFVYQTEGNSYPGNPVATRSVEDIPGWPDIAFPPFTDPASNFAIGTAIFYQTFRPDGGLDPLNRREILEKTRGFATFAGLDFDLTDRVTLRGELRYANDNPTVRNYRYQRCFLNSDLDPAPDTPCPEEGAGPSDLTRPLFDLRTVAPVRTDRASGRFDAWVGRIGVDFKVTDDWMIYASVAEGDKPGGVEIVEVTVGGIDDLVGNGFEPEKLTAYELGVKGIALDRLSIDAAVFFNDWRDVVLRQLTETTPEGVQLDQPVAFKQNSGDAKVLGFEIAATLAITEGLTASASLGHVDAELRNAVLENLRNFPTFAPDGNVSGNQLLRQPEWDASASLAYRHELRGDWDWFVRGDVTYQSAVYVGNDNQSWLPERTYVNGRLGFRSPRYSVELWGRNLFNDTSAIAAFRDIYFTNTDSVTPPYADLGPRPTFDKFVPFRYTVTYPRERTYGINFEVRFGGLVD